MIPESTLRQAPIPLHCSIALVIPSFGLKSKWFAISIVEYSRPYRRFSVMGGESTILPGFMIPA